ncbi:dynein intermediate chain 2, axonemal-like [Odontomachus brunneus]|uniref:dynein intermediate chain 2, axonemal-like n=1 Tax=Odontomachus brunneus TaxID=486640 RepID=UPI0013F1F79B|nr:dynein intermediate chain 2, axonemal-like [Odontomachus brunneus]
MEIKQIFLKTRAEFGKQCIFDTWGPHMDEEIRPNPVAMADYITRTHCNVGVLHTKQFALHEAQTANGQTKSSGMFHFEGGWPREINPKDEETTARFRRRVEKDDEWAPKLRNLFQQMEHGVLQNGALNIYEQYFDDMVPTELVKPRDLRTLNVYENLQTPAESVNDISWSPDSGSKMVVSYYSELGTQPDYSNIVYIWQIDNPNEPWMTLKATSATLVSEFNPRDPSVLASGLMSGQVCSWDVRTGSTPVQTSHRQFSHRDATTTVKWITTKSNTEFFSGSTDGRAMWWDTRKLRKPTEILVFDLQTPNEPQIDRAIGVSSANFEPSVSTKFMFGLQNGVVISGSRKARTPAEKLAWTFDAHHGPVLAVDRNSFNPKIFLTVGDCIVRVWAEDAKDSSLVSTRFIKEDPVSGCWNKARHSIFYVTTRTGILTVWDLLVGLSEPILSVQICKEKLTAIAAHERGDLLAVGNSAGNVFLVESTEALYSFDKNDKNDFSLYLEGCSRFVKAIDTRLKEIKLTRTYVTEDESKSVLEVPRGKRKNKLMTKSQNRDKQKTQEDKLKNYRKKNRIIKKKRPKDEFDDLRIVEERFFEIVEKEKQKYEEDERLSTASKIISTIRKAVSRRKIDKDSIETMDEAEDVAAEIPAKKIAVAKKTKIVIPTTEVDLHVEQEKPMVEEPLPPQTEVIVESPTEEISKRKRRKRLMPVAFRLPRPCKVGVCKPDICCRGKLNTRHIESPAVVRFADRAARDRMKWTRDGIDMEKRSEDEVGARTPAERKVCETRQKKRESWTKLVRAYKRKASSAGTIRSLWEMTELPEELQGAARKAKREIREAKRSSETRTRVRKLAKRVLKTSATAAEKSREAPRGLQEKEKGWYPTKEVTPRSTTARILAARKGKRAVMMDPCTPWKPPSLLKDLQSLLGGPLPESIEEKTNPGMARIKELEAARGRVYPRISDFHSID